MKLAINVAAMLIAFIAILALFDAGVGQIRTLARDRSTTELFFDHGLRLSTVCVALEECLGLSR
jgi:nucleoside permease NupC